MSRLLLFRHAKSSWTETALTDFDRPLAQRGLRAAPMMGQYMQANDLLPDRILCSSALRTRETLAAILPFMRKDMTIELLREIYDALDDDYRDIIAAHAGQAETLMVIGHNPVIHDTALALVCDGDPGALQHLREGFPTAALAVIEFKAPTAGALEPGSGHLTAFIKPRELEAMLAEHGVALSQN
ncbi:histidine phosphatase family protein [Breoghania sp.]|uniref:SixA phosphatase family protein n=1 Tax=Breoghania sp. TaxID=2065378 RepID=UPI002AAC2D26|nr:histidine phosphatase family protein [Breoghania sp.]